MIGEGIQTMLSTDLDNPLSIPYFLWDEPMTVADLRRSLSGSRDDDRFRLLGKVLREARDRDVWKFTTPKEVRDGWEKLSPYLGRRRSFWEFLLKAWEKEGLID
jgi:hypothetical protein